MHIRKICLIIPSLQPGGMERVMSELANYFILKNNIEVSIILYGLKRDIFYEISNKVKIFKPKFIFNNSFRFIYTFKTFLFLRNTVTIIKPDCILSFGEIWNNFVLLATYGLGVPVYISDRSSPIKKLGFIHENLRKILYPNAAGVICQTELAKEIYKLKFRNNNLIVISNPVKKISSKKNLSRENIVLSVGRLIKTKNHDILIKIFADINNTDWQLFIIGDDAQKQNNKKHLQKLINDLNVNDRVFLLGTRMDVDKFYLQSKIFAFTSSSEGFPNVICEAMSAGLPVISFDCVAGPSELVKDGQNGFIVSLFDIETYKLKLKSLMDDEELRKKMGKKSLEIVKKFSIENIGEQYLNFLSSSN